MISLSFILFSYWMSFWIAAYPDGALRVLEDGKDRSLKLPLEPWFMEKMTALLPKVGIERSLRLLGGGVNRKHTHKHAYLRAHTQTCIQTHIPLLVHNVCFISFILELFGFNFFGSLDWFRKLVPRWKSCWIDPFLWSVCFH